MTTLTYYKIRNKSNPELFRMTNGSWNGSGKVYDTLGKLRTVITMHMNSSSEWARAELDNWEIVEFEVQVKQVKQLIDIVDKKKIWDLLKK